jgi:hypothetical protein
MVIVFGTGFCGKIEECEQVHDPLWQRISRTNAPYLNVPA